MPMKNIVIFWRWSLRVRLWGEFGCLHVRLRRGNWIGCLFSVTGRVPQWCGLPKARVLWTNSPLVCKRWWTFVFAFVFWQQKFACLQSSHRMYVKCVSVCWLVTLLTYVVSVSWVWCEQIVCSECVCVVCVRCVPVYACVVYVCGCGVWGVVWVWVCVSSVEQEFCS